MAGAHAGGWQFPDHLESDYDANWLKVEFEADFGPELRVTRRSALAFLTWELQWFISAGRAISPGGVAVSLAGLEPCLSLEATWKQNNTVAVEVGVALEFAPLSREPFDEPFEKTVFVTEGAFRRFIEQLAVDLAPCPERKVEA